MDSMSTSKNPYKIYGYMSGDTSLNFHGLQIWTCQMSETLGNGKHLEMEHGHLIKHYQFLPRVPIRHCTLESIKHQCVN